MNNYQSLNYQHVSFKGSHNSYQQSASMSVQLTFDYSDPSNYGCRGLELDIWRNPNQMGTPYLFTVGHTSSDGPPLSSYFTDILNWHNANNNHDPVFITLDIKSSDTSKDPLSNFPGELDSYLTTYFGSDLIFTPGMVMANPGQSLAQNVMQSGFPTLSEMQNKFLFCLSGNDDWKSYYANDNIAQRLCFSDQDESDSDKHLTPPTTGNIVVFNFHIYTRDIDIWTKTVPLFKAKNYLVRVYEASSSDLWDASKNAGVTNIATDNITGTSWANVGPAPFC
jgi:Phosphoinositide phospholipase C, Ca2+-dependent